MTVTTVSALSQKKQKMARPFTVDDLYRGLDRRLALEYIQLLHRRAAAESNAPQIFKPRMDLCDDPQATQITAILEVPGVHKEDLSLHIEGDSLTVRGQRRPIVLTDSSGGGDRDHEPHTSNATAVTNGNQYVRELRYGEFRRHISLPSGTQSSDISATLRDGMLILSWPRIRTIPSEPTTGAASSE